MIKSNYLILSGLYFDFNDDLTEIKEIKALFENQNILDIFRFDKIKSIKKSQFMKKKLNFIYLSKNIEKIELSAFLNNKIEILDLSNCINLKVINENAFEKNPLNEIKILDNINIEYYKYLKNDLWTKFVIYYNDTDKKSGDYKLENDEWKWYPL